MNYSLQFQIDQLPPMNTADGLHWRKRNKLKKQWEFFVWEKVRLVVPPKPLAYAIVDIIRYSSMEPDYDNLVQGGKFLLDALVQCAVLKDDKPAVIARPSYGWSFASPKKGKVIVTVRQSTKGIIKERRARQDVGGEMNGD